MTAEERTGRRAIGWAVVLLTGIVAMSVLVTNVWLQFFLVFIPLAVIVHEFAHAFQAKARGHVVASPAVAMLRIKLPTLIAVSVVTVGLGIADFGPSQARVYVLAGLLVAAGILYWRRRSTISWALPIPMGIGMHITHTHRDWSDVIVGSIAEAALWTLIGTFAAPIWITVGLATLAVNLIPIKIGGEANDGLCLIREQRARMRGEMGVTQV